VRASVGGALLLVAAGIAAPFIRADRYGEDIRAALERGLNRKVKIGNKVTFNLFTGPGFTIEDVIVYDDPAAGIEPFAHMPELEARVRLSTLLTGRIEFARLRFVEPSVNIVKPVDGPLNIVPLFARTVAARPTGDVARFPEIQVTDGRINFKVGDTKSPFYFLNADITIAPRSSEKGAFLVRFSGEPARTDRGAIGSGEFQASGRIITAADREPRIEIDIELDRGDLADLAALVRGHRVGLHGVVISRAKVWGPISDISIAGDLTIEDLHRWNVMPSAGAALALKYRGAFSGAAHRLQLTVLRDANYPGPISGSLRIEDVFQRPHGSAELVIEKLPASALAAAARDLGAPVPGELSVHGDVTGVLGYSSRSGLQGQFTFGAASVKLGDAPQLAVEHATVMIKADELRLTRTALVRDNRASEIEAVYRPGRQQFDATITGRALPIADLASGALIAAGGTPLVERFSGGTWSGWVRYRSEAEQEGSWTANLDVRETTTTVPGMADPVKIASANVELDGADITMRRMRLAVGEIEISGDYRYTADDNRHTFNLAVPSASGEEIERILMPSLSRRSTLLARLRLRRARLPEFLARRRAEGKLQISTLSLGSAVLRGVHTRVVWNGASIRLPNFEARMEEGSVFGRASVELTATGPRYELDGRMAGMVWRGGRVDVDGIVETAGTGADLLLNLRSNGKFHARSLNLLPEYPLSTLDGAFTFTIGRSGPQLQLTTIEAAVGAERFSGHGGTHADGRLAVDLASASRVMHVTGPVAPLRLEVVAESK
jgi:hypothetical protein